MGVNQQNLNDINEGKQQNLKKSKRILNMNWSSRVCVCVCVCTYVCVYQSPIDVTGLWLKVHFQILKYLSAHLKGSDDGHWLWKRELQELPKTSHSCHITYFCCPPFWEELFTALTTCFLIFMRNVCIFHWPFFICANLMWQCASSLTAQKTVLHSAPHPITCSVQCNIWQTLF